MPGLWPRLYATLTATAAPFVRRYLAGRCRRGKEDAARLAERFGIAAVARPPGALLWIHAASVGEVRSVLSLAERVIAARPAVEVLLTTGTVASARLLADRLPPRARHQFVPVDVPRAVAAFLDHWRPDLAIWVESELWPNLVFATASRRIPMLLVNGRLSASALARWRLLPGLIRPILAAFALCLAQDATQAARFRELGAGNVACLGDLKAAAPPLAADPAALDELRRQIDGRPVWLAASTHPGEEEAAAAAHRQIAQRRPGLLTILAPRHPARGAAIAEMLRRQGLGVSRRAAGEPIAGSCDIYLVDTMGELGLFFRLVDIAFIGGSLAKKGGHNPFEAARLGCAVLHGPDVANCAAMTIALDTAGAALPVSDADGLAAAVSRLLADPTECETRGAAALRVAAAGDGVMAAVLGRLAPWLDALGPDVAAHRAGAPMVLGIAAASDARA